jgi:hypothetical protein
MPLCPICGGAMWDDRTSKRNPRAPDFNAATSLASEVGLVARA